MIKKIRRTIKLLLGYDKIQQKIWDKRNPYLNTEYANGFIFNENAPVIGLVSDIAQEYAIYIKVCIEMQQNYEVVDPTAVDWIERFQQSRAQAFLFWPTIYKPIQKQFWDERIYTISVHLKKKIFPSFDVLWLYESKRKTLNWLESRKLPHPDTKVFFHKQQALDFLKSSSLPIVIKTDQGASASGVYIVKSLSEGVGFINKAFRRGLMLKNKGYNDRHQGYIIFQEFLPDCEEWRIVRVGKSYFCRFKIRVGEFHSGSGDIEWAKPPRTLLDQTRLISEEFDVPNINVDFFKTTDGRFLINEIHALWGGKDIRHEELEGRYLYDEIRDEWIFEKGDFFRNRCANLRIEWIQENWLKSGNEQLSNKTTGAISQ